VGQHRVRTGTQLPKVPAHARLSQVPLRLHEYHAVSTLGIWNQWRLNPRFNGFYILSLVNFNARVKLRRNFLVILHKRKGVFEFRLNTPHLIAQAAHAQKLQNASAQHRVI